VHLLPAATPHSDLHLLQSSTSSTDLSSEGGRGPGGRPRPRPDIDESLVNPSEAKKEEKLVTGLSEGGTLIEFVTGPSLAREDVENRTEKADLMAKPENLPHPPPQPGR